MYWNNASELVPDDGELVLIQKGEIIDFARFDSGTCRFLLRNGDPLDRSEDLQWMELVRPSPFLKI